MDILYSICLKPRDLQAKVPAVAAGSHHQAAGSFHSRYQGSHRSRRQGPEGEVHIRNLRIPEEDTHSIHHHHRTVLDQAESENMVEVIR